MMANTAEPARKFYKGKKVLITGSSGYIAGGIIDFLSNIECTLYRVSRNASRLDKTDCTAEIIDFGFDIQDTEKWSRLLSEIKVDIIYHMAAQTSSVVADNDPVQDYRSNVLPLINMLTGCERNNIHPSIIFAGTVTEIGLSDYLPVDGTHYEKPVTIYDIHKLTAEKYLEYYSVIKKINGCTLRLANIYGPGRQSSSSDRGILNLMVQKAINGEALTVYGKGNYQRDYLYIDDVISAFLIAGINIKSLNGSHYIIGRGESTTISKLANIIADRVALKTCNRVEVKYIPSPLHQSPIEKRNFIADIQEFVKSTGWQPEYKLVQGIDQTIEAFL